MTTEPNLLTIGEPVYTEAEAATFLGVDPGQIACARSLRPVWLRDPNDTAKPPTIHCRYLHSHLIDYAKRKRINLPKETIDPGHPKAIRAGHANAVLVACASYGRRFFSDLSDKPGRENDEPKHIAHFVVDQRQRVWYIDSYRGSRVYTHDNEWKGFSNGGTLKALCEALRDYILYGCPIAPGHLGPWHETCAGGDLWGYGEDMEKVRQALADCPAIERRNWKVETIPPELWGRDHWSTLGYVETVMTDCGGFECGYDPKMRSNRRNFRVMGDNCPYPKRFGLQSRRNGVPMDPTGQGTRLRNGTVVDYHDDWMCLQDMAAAGLFVETDIQPRVILHLSDLGRKVANDLRAWKAAGKTVATFQPDLEGLRQPEVTHG